MDNRRGTFISRPHEDHLVWLVAIRHVDLFRTLQSKYHRENSGIEKVVGHVARDNDLLHVHNT